ncbi:MAG: hypothetical protein CO065_10390 [Comamonadaceae bacterium CG_4_9_14_0_8_um_filter_57_21]|nr:MAG: hypothetical protein CO065_10390 [Comamonadaceae bacterium CG_4_9_14_0_8_um_filter_57_21]
MFLRCLPALLLVLTTCICGFALVRYDPISFEASLLFWFRDNTNIAKLAGPAWMTPFWLSLSWLGNTLPRTVVSLCTVLGLIVLRRWQAALFLSWVLLSGLAFSITLKHWIERPRPQWVPQLDDVITMGFPSGHALNSTLFYLTVATMFAPLLRRQGTRWALYTMAICLSLATGVSRIALGVHYPTDVIAGWVIAGAWVWLWSNTARQYWPMVWSNPSIRS